MKTPKAPSSRSCGLRRADTQSDDKTITGLRRTGIRVVGDMPWGSRLCIFYETMSDLLSTAAAYFRAGLESGEFCIWAVSEPLKAKDAQLALMKAIPKYSTYASRGQIEILENAEVGPRDEEIDQRKLRANWLRKLRRALAHGYQGLRISSNAYWLAATRSDQNFDGERARVAQRQRMIILSTYPLYASRLTELFEIARMYHCTMAKRKGRWELLATPDMSLQRMAPAAVNESFDTLIKSFPICELLTARERAILAQILRGSTSKETGRMLGISPRTVEFHRANIIKKLNAKNTVDLVRRVLRET